ncbi:peptidase inhibitor family I36 protein [Nocardia sp. NBC_00565]|uniref:peptidase inhibitor family I36 protein n=1 Tax=Nocardia sp. NBC_00565 TaxID=2975993 RepID=UPI002E82108D|nr:peptidase inhibitor family I36 protein [Nocardia sp. NBC_00565]WUC01797.1 peptidase inhibitor family I36 protein [Nocardia sp. NBC_00565]
MKITYRASAMRRLVPLAAAVLTLGAGAAVTMISAAPALAAPGYDCPGGVFCGWDGRDGTGSMIVQVDASCVLHDIGNGGVGDRLTSYWNRTGRTVGVYNWTGERWQLLASVANDARGTLPPGADNRADAVKVCD